MSVVIGIIVALLLVGSIIAVAWWNVSARAAPYADESERARARREQAEREERAATVVIAPPAASPPAGAQTPTGPPRDGTRSGPAGR
jgi:hypothetical protein